MDYLTNKMQDTNSFHTIIAWLSENWEKIAGFGIASQLIDRFFKWLTKRSEARIKEIYNEQYDVKVKPEITRLASSIDALKESIWELKDEIRK